MEKTSMDYCRKCKYSSTSSSNSSYLSCDYYFMTGNRRNCKVGECDKHKPRKEGMVKRMNPNTFVPYFKKGNVDAGK